MSTLGNNLLAQYYAQNQYGIWLPEKFGYVTDGLVAMFDGEYNAGNKHDSNAIKWKDCVRGIVLTYEGINTFSWADKACIFGDVNGYGAFTKYDVSLIGSTLESSLWWETNVGTAQYSYPCCCATIGNMSIEPYKYNTIACRFSGIRYAYQGVDLAQKNSTKTLHKNIIHTCGMSVPSWDTRGSMSLHYDGSSEPNSSLGFSSVSTNVFKIGGRTLSPSTSNVGKGGVCCVRLYNRVLTEQEILQNYNVDRDRFGTIIE